MLSNEFISFPTKQFSDPVLLIVSDLHFFAYLPCLLYVREVFKIEMIVPPPFIGSPILNALVLYTPPPILLIHFY